MNYAIDILATILSGVAVALFTMGVRRLGVIQEACQEFAIHIKECSMLRDQHEIRHQESSHTNAQNHDALSNRISLIERQCSTIMTGLQGEMSHNKNPKEAA